MSQGSLDFDKLRIVFRRASCLPQLPRSAVWLIKEIDSDTTSAASLERIISTDPALTTEILRVASHQTGKLQADINSLRQAILLLGQRSIRAVAVSLSLRNVIRHGNRSARFDHDRYARHSLFVATLARYLQVRAFPRNELSEVDWTAEELFAGGLLHDLGLALLAYVDSAGFDRVWQVASILRVDLGEAFTKVYGGNVNELGAIATESWELPGVLVCAQRHLHDPLGYPEQLRGLCCLQYADQLAIRFGETQVTWPLAFQETLASTSLIRVAEEELELVADLIRSDTEQLLTGRPIASVA